MNPRNRTSDLGEFRRALLRSADLDAGPVPDAVRRRVLSLAAAATGGVVVSGIAASSAAATASSGTTGAAVAGVALTGATSAGAAGAAGAASVTTLGTVALWVGAGALLGALGIGVAQGTRAAWLPSPAPSVPHASTAAHRPRAVPRPVGSEARTPPFVAGPTPEPAASSPLTPQRTQAIATASPRGRPNPTASMKPLDEGGTPALAPELALLDRARAALAQGDPQGSLAILEIYKSRFPQGALRPEAAQLSAQARAQAGSAEFPHP